MLVCSDEETGGPGGKALAQLTVYIFVAALNNVNEDKTSTSGKGTNNSGSKRQVEWDYLSNPGFRWPPPKKMTLVEDELGIMMLPSNSSNIFSTCNHEQCCDKFHFCILQMNRSGHCMMPYPT